MRINLMLLKIINNNNIIIFQTNNDSNIFYHIDIYKLSICYAT